MYQSKILKTTISTACSVRVNPYRIVHTRRLGGASGGTRTADLLVRGRKMPYTASNSSIQGPTKSRKAVTAVGWFRLLLYPVHGQSHGQFRDQRNRCQHGFPSPLYHAGLPVRAGTPTALFEGATQRYVPSLLQSNGPSLSFASHNQAGTACTDTDNFTDNPLFATECR